MIRCRVTLIDATWQPPRFEASFTDARGREVRVHDKEPIFRDGTEPEGEGAIRCRLVSGALMGDPDAICVVATDSPDDVEATDGATTFEVRASQLASWPRRSAAGA